MVVGRQWDKGAPLCYHPTHLNGTPSLSACFPMPTGMLRNSSSYSSEKYGRGNNLEKETGAKTFSKAPPDIFHLCCCISH